MAAKDPAKNYAQVKAWRKANPAKVAAQAAKRRPKVPHLLAANSKRWRERHIDERRIIEATRAKVRRDNNPEISKGLIDRRRQKREEKYLALAGRPRPSVCDLCKQNNNGIVFDHCHQHGHFRGWLCDRCNRVLGLIKDSPALLRKMARYLEQSNGKAVCKSAQLTPIEQVCGPGS